MPGKIYTEIGLTVDPTQTSKHRQTNTQTNRQENRQTDKQTTIKQSTESGVEMNGKRPIPL